MLSRKEISHVLAMSDTTTVCSIAKVIGDRYKIKSIRTPQKTLAMVKVREPIKASLFYLGEVLCCECMLEVEGVRGFSVMMGDDYKKVTSAAMIDAIITGNFDEKAEIIKKIEQLDAEIKQSRAKRNSEILKSRVDFNVMGE